MPLLCGWILPRLLRQSTCSSVAFTMIRSCKSMNDPFEHATGLEKKLLIAAKEGNYDPFDLLVLKRGDGTKDDPNLIPSAFNGRLVGCICEEDQTYIQYMWLIKGTPKRCECGHWFKLVVKEPLH